MPAVHSKERQTREELYVIKGKELDTLELGKDGVNYVVDHTNDMLEDWKNGEGEPPNDELAKK